jgi:hypothetical protein
MTVAANTGDPLLNEHARQIKAVAKAAEFGGNGAAAAVRDAAQTGGLRARPWLMLRKPHSMLMAVRFEMAARKGVR